MADQPKRKLFQIHLSTALVLMFVAGGLVWLNVRKVKMDYEEQVNSGAFATLLDNPVDTHIRGWPWKYQTYWEVFAWLNTPEWQECDMTGVVTDEWHLAYNILVALAILAVIGVVVEWAVRKKGKAML